MVGAAARALAADPSTLTARATGGDGWTRVEHLLCLILDQLRIANWQRTGKRAGRPKPISPLANQGTTHGHTDQSPENVRAYLERVNPDVERV